MWQLWQRSIRNSVEQMRVFGQLQQQQRWNSQIFLRKRFDRSTGTYKYENWDFVVQRLRDPVSADGKSLLNRYWSERAHIKPKEVRRRINDRKEYNRKVKRVQDLTQYIKFMQDHQK